MFHPLIGWATAWSFDRLRLWIERGIPPEVSRDRALSVDERGGLRLKSGEQRFYESWLGFSFPLSFSGNANVCEWFDDVFILR